LPKCLLNVFLPLLSRTINYLNKLLMSLAFLCLFSLIDIFISAFYLNIEGLLLLLLFNDLRVIRESIFNMLRDFF
jgi:hypothetical protein